VKLTALALILAFASPAAAPLDSQVVIERYSAHLLQSEPPKVLVFSYSVVQAGPHDLAETHLIYRSGDLVRDETLVVDGVKARSTRIARYRNRYTLENLAPRLSQYSFLFEQYQRSGSSLAYVFRAVPLSPPGAFVIDGMTVDGRTFLPAVLRFHAGGASSRGTGTVSFVRAGKYWVPAAVSIEATVDGKPAREHFTFWGYRFPRSLPKSTFLSPKPLPAPVLPEY
jgi:hypothetical protein